MKKRLFSLLCALTLLLSALPRAAALEGEAQRAADTLQTLGILDAAAGLFGDRLTAVSDRLTAVSLLVRLAGADTGDAGPSGFQDVPESAARDVAYAAAQGWIGGVSPGVFGASQPITANAWFTMLLRMLGYRDSEGDFAVSDAARFAQRLGLVSRPYEGPLTGGDLVETGVEILSASFRDGSGTVAARLVSRGRCSQAALNALGLSGRELNARQIADRHMAAVFCLDLFSTQEAIDENDSDAQASGFFVTPDGIAVTNYHSIDEAIRGVATLSTGEQYLVESVLWYDVSMDLAVLRISRTSLEQKTTSAFAHLDIAGTTDIRPGDVVYTLSNPLGMGLAVSGGVISAIARVVDAYALPCVMNTADISSGSSGGALLNIYGRVIAVTSGAFRAGNNMYLAVPADPVADLLKNPETALLSGKSLQAVAEEQDKLTDAALADAASAGGDSVPTP